jgi:hypothetical protein
MIFFFNLPNSLILPAALGPEIHSACGRNEYQKQKNKADNLAAICEPIV